MCKIRLNILGTENDVFIDEPIKLTPSKTQDNATFDVGKLKAIIKTKL